MIVSMKLNTPKLSLSHLSPATAIFVVDGCQFGPSWIFGLKMELMACADLVGVTTEQIYIFPGLIFSINDIKYFLNICIISQPCHSHFIC